MLSDILNKYCEPTNSEKTGLFALWCASNNANEFSGKMISENDQIVSAKYKAWISAQNLKL